ncbi:hypothetical protein CIHG_02613 [Coccidioides immitis H538.4]|uniref:Uncharacterized protein n=3 Tax=Coccidioides immitis TaxID=5501 RepID=A0A0J8TG91_COCIT|nr:hypothetical protein CIRG_02940 [Coccidioides immitis RMSCC 2394]KMU72647.1 hypothetical protein CISG_09739 [Coccidioides immitis RMSCC 3703]KMU84829.1 hypothetical protein CIHG_02613 [Coccidioides immitis H538.4]
MEFQHYLNLSLPSSYRPREKRFTPESGPPRLRPASAEKKGHREVIDQSAATTDPPNEEVRGFGMIHKASDSTKNQLSFHRPPIQSKNGRTYIASRVGAGTCT